MGQTNRIRTIRTKGRGLHIISIRNHIRYLAAKHIIDSESGPSHVHGLLIDHDAHQIIYAYIIMHKRTYRFDHRTNMHDVGFDNRWERFSSSM